LSSPCLEGIGQLYAVREPGEAGERFVDALRSSRLAERVRIVSFGTEDGLAAGAQALRLERHQPQGGAQPLELRRARRWVEGTWAKPGRY
jgi:hypothetical protein